MNGHIEVQIGEMALEGVPVAERYRFADVFQVELERLLEADGACPDGAGDTRPAILAARSVYEEVVRCMREATAGRQADPGHP